MRLVLGSASPARLATLRAAGIEPMVVVSGVDESDVVGAPSEVALELAIRMARAVAAGCEQGDLVLGCDSVLDLDGEVFGKPANAADAEARWHRMRGRTGTLLTGHCVIDVGTGHEVAEVTGTLIRFGSPSDAEIRAYVATGEPLLVAGAFTIDGRGGWFVDGIDGDHSNVVGVSLPLLRRLLAALGIEVTDLWD